MELTITNYATDKVVEIKEKYITIEMINNALKELAHDEETDEFGAIDFYFDDGDFPGWRQNYFDHLEKSPDWDEFVEFLDNYEDLDRSDKEAFGAYLEVAGLVENCIYKTFKEFNKGYFSFYRGIGLEELAEELVDEGLFGDVSDTLKDYIDYEELGSSLGRDGYEETFWGCIRID